MSEIPTGDWTWINEAADRFERAWKTGPRPKIEDYLTEAELGSRPRCSRNCSASNLSFGAAKVMMPRPRNTLPDSRSIPR